MARATAWHVGCQGMARLSPRLVDQAMPNWLLTPQLLRVQSHRAKLIRFRRLHQCQSHEARMMLKAKNLQVHQSITVFETRMIQTPAGLTS